MAVLIYLAVIVLIVLVVCFGVSIYRTNKYVENVPFVPWQIMKQFISLKSRTCDTYKIIEQMFGHQNGLGKFFIGTKLVVVCDDPVDVKTILLSRRCVDKPYLYRLIPGARNGLFSSHGDRWRIDRKKMSSVFTMHVLKTFRSVFNYHFAQLVKKLEANVGQPDFDMTDTMFLNNLEIVCDTTLRYDAQSPSLLQMKKIFVASVARVWQIGRMRMTALILHSEFLYRRTHLYVEQQKIISYFVDITRQVKANAQLYRDTELSNRKNGDGLDSDESKPMILIDKLLEMEHEGTIDEELFIDHIYTFIVAATDTSAITMLSLLLMLAIHQDVQDRVYDEIRTHVDDLDQLDYDTLTKLDYTERTIKETMRMFPLAQGILRETDDDIQLSKCVIPKGSVLLLGVFKMHRNPDIWGPTANVFDPDRFLPDLMAERHPYAFLPFSAGPRNCVGAKYAMLAMKMMLCHMLMAYRLSTSIRMSDITLKFEVMLKMKNHCLLKLERRQ